MYRMNRMNQMYPDVVTAETLRVMTSNLESGNIEGISQIVESRRAEVQRVITDIQTRSEMARSGSSGARVSFGGGRSSGGRGGRW